MGWRVILLAGVLVISAALGVLIWRRRPQFSLRALMVACGLVAGAFSAWYSWQWWTLARLAWIDPSSSEARRILPEPSIVETDGKFRVTFRRRNEADGNPELLACRQSRRDDDERAREVGPRLAFWRWRRRAACPTGIHAGQEPTISNGMAGNVPAGTRGLPACGFALAFALAAAWARGAKALTIRFPFRPGLTLAASL